MRRRISIYIVTFILAGAFLCPHAFAQESANYRLLAYHISSGGYPQQSVNFSFADLSISPVLGGTCQGTAYKMSIGYLCILNSPPRLGNIGNKQIGEEQTLTFSVTAIDPDNDTLIYSASNMPPGATFDAETHIFNWIPESGQADVYENVYFEVSDSSSIDFEEISITVNDATAPAIPTVDLINSPTNIQTKVFTGTKSEDTLKIVISSVQATVNSISYPTATTWSCTATLQEGQNDFTAVAEDESGNQSAQIGFTVTLDTVPPIITLEQPTTPTNQDVTLSYTASDNLTPGSQIEITGDDSPYTEEGDYSVILTATDEAGNAAESHTVDFTVDRTPPNVVITYPLDGSYIGKDGQAN